MAQSLTLNAGVVTVVKFYADLQVGELEQTGALVADRVEMIAYAEVNDPYPIHLDAAAARAAGFDDVVASFGYTVFSLKALDVNSDAVAYATLNYAMSTELINGGKSKGNFKPDTSLES